MPHPVVVVDAVRTPIGNLGGSLKAFSAKSLGIHVVEALLKRNGLSNPSPPPSPSPIQGEGNRGNAPTKGGGDLGVDLVIFASARQAGQGPNIGRQVAVGAGIPVTTPSFTVNMACGSSLQALILAYQSIALEDAEVVVAGGVESMSQAPYLLMKARYGYRLGHSEILDVNMQDGYFCPMSEQLMGATVENLVEEYGISREAQDQLALESHRRALTAIKSNKFKEEIVPVTPQKKGSDPFLIDEHPREDTTLDQLSMLKTVFSENGTITAGNASAPTDGASACLLMSVEAAKKHKLTPLAVITGYASVGVEPKRMGISPSHSLQKLFQKTSTSMKDYDLLELNEAFAAQVLAVDKEIQLPFDRMNVNGGAIALGHPTGATGTRLVATLLHEMVKRKADRGIATLCISGGLGLAVSFKRP